MLTRRAYIIYLSSSNRVKLYFSREFKLLISPPSVSQLETKAENVSGAVSWEVGGGSRGAMWYGTRVFIHSNQNII